MFQNKRPPRPETSEALERLTQAGHGAEDESRRPRIAIMGEFSAGKSTLTNLLMGTEALPVRVTATQLPPVWLSLGDTGAKGVGVDETEFAVDLMHPERIPLQATRYLKVERPAEVLQMCDLIDFPGISDPNMPAEIWERAMPLADGVLWCTHATQAWRQSEAAFWEEMPEELRATSYLLVTRFDKLESERDRGRVLARVGRETEGLFAGVYPVSLTRAMAAGDDAAAFQESGAADVMDALLELVMRLSRKLGREIPLAAPLRTVGEGDGTGAGDRSRHDPFPARAPSGTLVNPPDQERIVPRRVRTRQGSGRTERPRRGATASPGASMALTSVDLSPGE